MHSLTADLQTYRSQLGMRILSQPGQHGSISVAAALGHQQQSRRSSSWLPCCPQHSTLGRPYTASCAALLKAGTDNLSSLLLQGMCIACRP